MCKVKRVKSKSYIISRNILNRIVKMIRIGSVEMG